jgi:hypothetical protein
VRVRARAAALWTAEEAALLDRTAVGEASLAELLLFDADDSVHAEIDAAVTQHAVDAHNDAPPMAPPSAKRARSAPSAPATPVRAPAGLGDERPHTR